MCKLYKYESEEVKCVPYAGLIVQSYHLALAKIIKCHFPSVLEVPQFLQFAFFFSLIMLMKFVSVEMCKIYKKHKLLAK